MKYYKNIDTNEIFSETELKALCDLFYNEAGFDMQNQYFDYIVGLPEMLEIDF